MRRLEALADREEAGRRETTARDLEWCAAMNGAVGSALPPISGPADATARVGHLVAALQEADDENEQLRGRLDQAMRDLGALTKIEDACPTCDTRSLVIDAGGHLLCTLPACKTVSVAQAWRARVGAVDALAEAAANAVKFVGEEHRDKLAAALLTYQATKEESR